jgi:murein DD-endopeptidase MepM/ murein hydrolase activator NlpD
MIDGISNLLSALPPEPAQPGHVGRQFETLLIKQLLAELPMPGLEGTQAETFMSMFHDALAQQLVEGGGLGLADQLDRAIPAPPPVGGRPEGRPALGLPPPFGGRPEGRPALGPLPPAPRDDLPQPVRLSSPFGVRRDPLDGHSRQHLGIDLAAPEGSPIHAAREGVVRFAGKAGGYGQLVIVDHGEGLETRYAHCGSIEVRAGDSVASGQRLAEVGATGRATGPHLHFEVRQRGVPVDPQEHLDFAQGLQGLIRGGVRDEGPSLVVAP